MCSVWSSVQKIISNGQKALLVVTETSGAFALVSQSVDLCKKVGEIYKKIRIFAVYANIV